MTMTGRELWTAFHGMVLGAGFLLAFSGALVSLWSLQPAWTTAAGARVSTRRVIAWAWGMALLAWLTVLVGTLVIYPMYRARPAAGAPVSAYPRYRLVSQPQTAAWHEFGMEWKEHLGWLAPILATAVAGAATACRKTLPDEPHIRRMLVFLLCVAFACAGVAGLMGALINKVAPIH
jgi:hypothetical protein